MKTSEIALILCVHINRGNNEVQIFSSACADTNFLFVVYDSDGKICDKRERQRESNGLHFERY